MLCRIFCQLFITLALSELSYTQRRVKDGKEVLSDKRYMVYLLSAPTAPNQYNGWMCGGAILSKDFVITSAACVEDVKHMYVIAGYKIYVPSNKMDEDQCVAQKKKKVIQTCVPQDYSLDYNKTEIWAKVDIALVKVESPFDFKDTSYETICSYIPESIEYNTESNFPQPGHDVIVLGWGHNKEYRKDTELVDMNQRTLQYAPAKVLDEKTCVKHYQGNQALASFIAASMICTLGQGKLDDKGKPMALRALSSEELNFEESLLNRKRRKADNHNLNKRSKNNGRRQFFIHQSFETDYDFRKNNPSDEHPEDGPDTKTIRSPEPTTDEITDFFTKQTETEIEDTPPPETTSFNYLSTTIEVIPDLITEGSSTVNDYDQSTDSPEPQETTEPTFDITETTLEDFFNPREETTATENTYGTTESTTDNYYFPTEQQTATTESLSIFDITEPTTIDYAINPDETTPPENIFEEDVDTPGICQNDHGGPLITWRGPKEILLAVATLYKLDKEYKCVGPYLFTKTSCNSKFIECIVNTEEHDETTRRYCQDPEKMGFHIFRRHITWIGHRDGPAENEEIQTRHQVPMSAYHPGKRQRSRLFYRKSRMNN